MAEWEQLAKQIQLQAFDALHAQLQSASRTSLDPEAGDDALSQSVLTSLLMRTQFSIESFHLRLQGAKIEERL